MVNSLAKLPDWLRTAYPFETHDFITPSGARMSYVDEGQGDEAVLMLHGNPTWSYYYTKLIQAVSPAMRCVVPDHIGMGLSDKPQDYNYSLVTRIVDIEALVQHLGLRKVHLVAHDWGGAIGFGFAVRHPELMGRFAVLNTAAFPSKSIPTRIALCRIPRLGSALVRGLNGFAGPAARMSMHRRSLRAMERRALLFPYGSWKDRVAVDAFVKDIPMDPEHPSWNPLSEVAAGLGQFRNHPMLIVWGGRDFCFNARFYDEWKQRFPQAENHWIPDAGHYVLLDADLEAVPSIRKFLVA